MRMARYEKGKSHQLSKNFNSKEFDCHGRHCCSETPINDKLVEVLQNIRDHYNLSVNINCGYRCPYHNARVSGASATSRHMRGDAADIHIEGIHPYRIARYAETIPGFVGRIGCYTWGQNNGFVHIDIRETSNRGIYTEGNVRSDAVASFSLPVTKGTKGRIVKVVQRFLKEQRDEQGNRLYAGRIDGSCGNGTTAAINKWNDMHGRHNYNIWDITCWDEAYPI